MGLRASYRRGPAVQQRGQFQVARSRVAERWKMDCAGSLRFVAVNYRDPQSQLPGTRLIILGEAGVGIKIPGASNQAFTA